MITRSLREWEYLQYGTADDCIPLWAADRLAAVARSSPLGGESGSPILTHGRKSLRAGQIVGVLAAEGCTLEVLPKIDGLDQGGTRRRLIHMLSVALDVDLAAGRLATIDWQRHTLLELLIRLFARKLLDAVRRGLPRSYIAHDEDLRVLRGRLDVKRQFTLLAASPQILACRYDSLSADTALNQIMKATVERLGRLSGNDENQRLLRELKFAYADITDVARPSLAWQSVVLDRTNGRWRDLLQLARFLLADRFQTTSLGGGLGFSLLFPMNVLFEEYVARSLQKTLRPDGLVVKRQGGLLYCLEEFESHAVRFQTRPDILVKRATETVLVIDTKWKRLSRRVDDPKQGISQPDIYQMMAYSRLYRCPNLVLLYPHHAELGADDGIVGRYRVTSSDDRLAIATIDVGQPMSIQPRLRKIVGSSFWDREFDRVDGDGTSLLIAEQPLPS